MTSSHGDDPKVPAVYQVWNKDGIRMEIRMKILRCDVHCEWVSNQPKKVKVHVFVHGSNNIDSIRKLVPYV